MASYDSTLKMNPSKVQLTAEQELLQLRQFPPQIPYVILEDKDYHLLSCSFDKPCFFCDDKYSTPDPVYCYGVLMGGIRRGKPETMMSNCKVSCEQAHHNHNNKKLLSRRFSRIQEDEANHDHQHLLSYSHENPSLVCDHNHSSSCRQPRILEKAP